MSSFIFLERLIACACAPKGDICLCFLHTAVINLKGYRQAYAVLIAAVEKRSATPPLINEIDKL